MRIEGMSNGLMASKGVHRRRIWVQERNIKNRVLSDSNASGTIEESDRRSRHNMWLEVDE